MSNLQSRFAMRAWIRDVLFALMIVPLLLVAVYAISNAYRIYHPQSRKTRKGPNEFGLPAIPTRIPVMNESLTLDAWWIPKDGAHHTVIVCHEWGTHKGSKLRHAECLHRAGYHVLLFDFRNHGESDLDPSWWGMSRRFTDDLESVIKFTYERLSCWQGKVAVVAFSFSTFPAIYVAATRRHLTVDAMILDSGPTLSLEALGIRFIEVYGKAALPAICKGPVGYRVYKYVFVRALLIMLDVKWPVPLTDLATKFLFIAGEHDAVAVPQEVERVMALSCDSEMWVAPGANHLMAYWRDPEGYASRVIDFLKRAF